MKILDFFSLRGLVLNKKRTILTIVGIILSTALIVSTSTLGTSFYETMLQGTIELNGNYHMIFEDVSEEANKYVTENINVETSFEMMNLGYAELEGGKNEDKPYVYIKGYDESAMDNMAIDILEGRMPENSNEILIPEHVESNGKVEYSIGDEITFDIGDRQLLTGEELTQNNPYLDEEENIVNKETKTYTVVGIMERMNYAVEDYSAPGYVLITYLDENTYENLGSKDIGVIYKKPADSYEIEKEIKNIILENTGETVLMTPNRDLISYQGGGNNAITNSLYAVIAIVIVIIVGTSIFVIRNSFSISTSEKMRQYGMLKSVGATKKQIKQTVINEGKYLGIIAIPIGIISGIFATWVLIIVVNHLLGDSVSELDFLFNVPILAIVAATVLAVITIYFSALIPAIRASKKPAIELIRGNDDIKIKRKKLKTSKLTKKLFGIGGVIASKNLKRSRKKYRTTVISIVVSIFTFISISTFFELGMQSYESFYGEIKYNINISTSEMETEETLKLVEELEKMEYVDTYSYWEEYTCNIPKSELSDDGKEKFEQYEENIGEEYVATIGFVIINSEEFKRYTEELGMENENPDEIVVISDIVVFTEESGKYTYSNVSNVKEGENIQLESGNNNIEITIDKKAETNPMGLENSYSEYGWIFVSENNTELISKLLEEEILIRRNEEVKYQSIAVNSSNPDELEENLNLKVETDEIFSKAIIYNINDVMEANKNIMLVIGIFLYGFITVITLIGVTNIFNTITTNMNLRSKEFANLKSIGMTEKEFNKMIRFESLLYGMKSLLIGIPLGIGGSYLIYMGTAGGIDYGYSLPIVPILISTIFVFIIIGMTMKYSISKINKQNIIETIRRDNI